MARFHSRSLAFLCQVLCPLLLLIFTSIIHSSNVKPLRGIELVKEICRHTSDHDFCINAIIPDRGSPDPWPTAVKIATNALSSAQKRADNARNLIARLLVNSTCLAGDPQACELLQMCQLHNKKAIADLSSAIGDLKSHNISAMVEDLNNATVATKSCQDIIQGNEGVTSSSELVIENDILTKFCEISLASTKFFPRKIN